MTAGFRAAFACLLTLAVGCLASSNSGIAEGAATTTSTSPSTAGASTTTPPPTTTLPATWRDYVGLEYEGSLPLLPGVISSGGQTLIYERPWTDRDYGLVTVRTDNGIVWLFYAARSYYPTERYQVVDVIENVDPDWYDFPDCRVNGVYDRNILARSQALAPGWEQSPDIAWRLNPDTERAEQVDPSTVLCTPGDD